jgi:ComF family protein
MSTLHNIKEGLSTVWGFVSPTTCFHCGHFISFEKGLNVCLNCGSEMPLNTPPHCEACGRHNFKSPCHRCLNEDNSALDRVHFLWRYQGPAKRLVQKIKLTEHSEYLHDIVLSALSSYNELTGLIDHFDALVPIPGHRKSSFLGAHGSAEGISRLIAERFNMNVIKLIIRTKTVTKQTQCTRSERLRNMENSLALRPTAKVPTRILLVDDVVTTGRTALLCAELLKNHGVSRVEILALARG